MSATVPSPGDLVDGRFRLENKLGQGAFGAVFRARDLEANEKIVAVKVLFEKYQRDRKMMQRFVQEAKLLERLQHPGITRAYHWCGDGELVYLAMELIDGMSLDKRCEAHGANGTFIPKQGVAWMCDQLCAVIDYAHQRDIIHRDLKPRNVMVNRSGARPFVKVLDFGIAKVLVGSEVDPTTVGRVLGSVLYIAPEQILSRPVDHRSDIFSLGTMLFEILTLRRAWARSPSGEPHPFHEPLSVGEHNNHVSVLRRIAREKRPSACAVRPDLSPAVDQVLERALAIDADQRYSTAGELAAALRMALLADRITAMPQAQTTVPNRPLPDEQDELPSETLVDPVLEGPDFDLVGEDSAGPTQGGPMLHEDPPTLAPTPMPVEPPPPPAAVKLDLTATMDGPKVAVEETVPDPASTPKVWPWMALGVAAALAAFLFFRFGLPV